MIFGDLLRFCWLMAMVILGFASGNITTSRLLDAALQKTDFSVPTFTWFHYCHSLWESKSKTHLSSKKRTTQVGLEGGLNEFCAVKIHVS